MKQIPTIDYQVAKKLGWEIRNNRWIDPKQPRIDANGDAHYPSPFSHGTFWNPTGDAAQMEPLIEKYRISVIACANPADGWIAMNTVTKLITTKSESRLEAAALCLLQMDIN